MLNHSWWTCCQLVDPNMTAAVIRFSKAFFLSWTLKYSFLFSLATDTCVTFAGHFNPTNYVTNIIRKIWNAILLRITAFFFQIRLINIGIVIAIITSIIITQDFGRWCPRILSSSNNVWENLNHKDGSIPACLDFFASLISYIKQIQLINVNLNNLGITKII